MKYLPLIAVAAVIALAVAVRTAGATTNYERAHRIIYLVFPRSTAPLAFRVASCETKNFTDFWNDGSHAKGLFQEMPGNDGRVFTWGRYKMKLRWNLISSVAPDWYAAQIALLQSKGGTDWSEWSCQP